jgi:hypothetical protein
MENYGPEGGYRKGMDMQEKYNCWAATQYREKVSLHTLESDRADYPASSSLCEPTYRLVTLLATTRIRDRPAVIIAGHS